MLQNFRFDQPKSLLKWKYGHTSFACAASHQAWHLWFISLWFADFYFSPVRLSFWHSSHLCLSFFVRLTRLLRRYPSIRGVVMSFLNVLSNVCWRMLTYADVCWRMQAWWWAFCTCSATRGVLCWSRCCAIDFRRDRRIIGGRAECIFLSEKGIGSGFRFKTWNLLTLVFGFSEIHPGSPAKLEIAPCWYLI